MIDLDIVYFISMCIFMSLYPALLLLIRKGDVFSPWMILLFYQILLIFSLNMADWFFVLILFVGLLVAVYIFARGRTQISWRANPESALEWAAAVVSLSGWAGSFILLAISSRS